MSPRFASIDDRDARPGSGPDPLEGGQPGRAERFVEREVRLDRRGVRTRRLEDADRRTRSTPATSGEKPRGRAAGSGSRPRHSTVPTAAVRVGQPLEVGRASLGGRAGGARCGAAGGRRRGSRQLVGRDEPARPRLAVEARHLGQRDDVLDRPVRGGRRSSRTRSRSTIWPWMCRNAIESPSGDQTGAHDAPSSVRRSSSRPFEASRITRSLPKLLVFVAAM